jgi:hypothetical protein
MYLTKSNKKSYEVPTVDVVSVSEKDIFTASNEDEWTPWY